MDVVLLAMGFLSALVLSLVVYFLFLKRKELISDSDLDALQASHAELQKRNRELEVGLGRQEERAGQLEYRLRESSTTQQQSEEALVKTREKLSAKEQVVINLEEKLRLQKEEMKLMGEQMRKEFENLANRIFEAKSEKFSRDSKVNLEQTLAPLKLKLKEFQDKVEFTHNDNIAKSAVLMEQIRGLKELNEQMSIDARQLTTALKGDSKTQGNWGELVLEKVLENSGLKEGSEYIVQGSNMGLKDSEGSRLKPDVIVMLPDEKQIIIDAKVSLTAYEKMVNAETEEERKIFAIEHVKSLRAHVLSLHNKQYHHLQSLHTPDFTLMFLPVEASFSIAVQTDYELFNYAWDRKIVIVSPTTLLATLRTVSSIWKQENQQRNAMEIAEQGGALIDKFVGFVDDLRLVGQKIEDSRKGYHDAMNKLQSGKGNLIRRAEKLSELGAKHKKQLPKDLLDKARSTDISFDNP